jgi:glucose-6-phosphate 1-dehydrogenase
MNIIVIFGASGDLTSRKLIPALYNLFLKKRLPEPLQIVGFSRTPMEDAVWRNKLAETTEKFAANVFSQEQWNVFAQKIHYHSGDIGNTADFQSLAEYLRSLNGTAPQSDFLYYLSTAPQFYGQLTQQLGKVGLAEEPQNGSCRVIIEKPFGTDLKTAEELNLTVKENFNESQIYRIDHYLGKETVNNVLVLRFANTIFEPIWNRNYIDNIQITANEDVLVGRRATYYETAGVLRDMFQNHLLQILTFATMEPPAVFSAKAVRDEKVKVFHSIRPMKNSEVLTNTFRGQYIGYQNEPGVAAGSRTATYGAVRLLIDNWRWKDVPIFLRSGKGMSCRTTQILIQFRRPPHLLFSPGTSGAGVPGNKLLIQIQPAEGIQLYFTAKQPDTEMDTCTRELNFNFKDSFSGVMPDSYERLLLDAIHGDASLFARSDEVEAAWKIIDPIQQVWDSSGSPEPELYEVGSIGPDSAESWIKSFGADWFNLCPII